MYEHSKIYKIQCSDGYFYIGCTTNELRYRFRDHKNASKKESNRRVLKHINSIGWDNAKIILIENFPCENKQQLLQKEDEHIQKHINDQFCLNTSRAFLTEEEHKEYLKKYYQANKEKINQRQREDSKKYHQANKEKINEKAKEYREINKDKIKEREKEYNQINRDKINQRQREYYEANKDKLKEYYEANKEKINQKKREYYLKKKQEK